jgi:hypothetical protein
MLSDALIKSSNGVSIHLTHRAVMDSFQNLTNPSYINSTLLLDLCVAKGRISLDSLY